MLSVCLGICNVFGADSLTIAICFLSRFLNHRFEGVFKLRSCLAADSLDWFVMLYFLCLHDNRFNGLNRLRCIQALDMSVDLLKYLKEPK